jgi:hypothetical protein
MRSRFLSPSKLAAASLVIAVLGCDVFQKDPDVNPASSQDFQMYVYQNKAAVLDLASAFPNLDKVVVPGSKTNVKYFSDRYIKYQSVGGNADSFTFSLTTKDKQQVNAKVSVITGAGDNCGEAFTYAQIKKDSRLVVNLFNNPEFCGYDIYDHSPVAIADALPSDEPQNDQGVLLSLCGCGAEGNTGILYFTPAPGFVGRVVSKYYMGVLDPNAALTSQEDYYKPDKFRFFSAHKFIIDVVE